MRKGVKNGLLAPVLRTQLVGPAAPLCADADSRLTIKKPRRRQCNTRCDQCQKLRLLTLCHSVVVTAAEPEETSNGAVADSVEEYQAPTKSGRRNAQGCKCMPSIVLAISERAFAVLPGFPPMDRREAHEEGILGKWRAEVGPRVRVEARQTFDSVYLQCVVVHA